MWLNQLTRGKRTTNLAFAKLKALTISMFEQAGIIFLTLLLFPGSECNPSITIVPFEKNVVRFLGEYYFVSCQSESEIHWYDPNGVKVPTSPWSRVRTEEGFGLDLFINYIREDDEGEYSCVTPFGRKEFNLTVVQPILFDLSLDVQTALFGEDFILKCAATGNSSPLKIYWKVDKRFPRAPHFQGLEDGSLLIRNVMAQDAHRKYKCRAVDPLSPKPDAKEMEITLKVEMKPSATGNEGLERWGIIGELVNLTCSVVAEPPAEFSWYHKSTKLENSNETIISNPEENISLLQIYLRNDSKLGTYYCVARNKLGSYNQVLTLNKGSKPSKPILTIERLGRHEVVIRVLNELDQTIKSKTQKPSSGNKTVGVNLQIIGYIVQYRMRGRIEWQTPAVTLTKYGFILRGLIPNVTYNIRAASQNKASIGDYSETLQFRTPKYGDLDSSDEIYK